MKHFAQLLVLTLLSTSALANNNNNNNNGKGKGNGNNNGNGKGKGNGKGNNGGGNNSAGGLTLDSSVVNSNAAQNGFNASNTLQTNSLTSTNNFINFCKGKTLTNGLQVKTGSCNGIVMGDIPNTSNMPAAKFVQPKNLDTVVANQNLTIAAKITGLQTGLFTNAETNYYGAPQQLNAQGQVKGHTHFVISEISALDSTTPGSPLKFAFFKGIDTAADQNGVSSVVVPGGLPTGTYRMCTINTSENHVPVLGPVAQHDSFDDCIYFIAKSAGKIASEKKGSKGKNGRRHRPRSGQRMVAEQGMEQAS